MKEEYSTKSTDREIIFAKAFVVKAKKIAHVMSANYNQKKNAYEAASTSFNKKGSLDINRIHSYRTSDDIFKKQMVVNNGKSHGLVCALDFSISMRTILVPVAMQFLITSLFCKYAKIDFRFFTFTTDTVGAIKTNKPKETFLVNNDRYSRFVDIGNNTMSESELINNFYHIMTFQKTMGRTDAVYNSSYSQKYLNFIKYKFSTMQGTPLVPALYQSYLVAKWLQDSGIQNAKILIINDGDNNYLFRDAEPTSIEDPYSRRIYKNESKDSNGIIASINKMARDNNIDVINIFLGNRISERSFEHILNDYMSIHGKKLSFTPTLFSDFNKKKIISIDNLCYYNKVVIVDSEIFPINVNDHKSLPNTGKSIITKHASDIKSLSILGKIISDFIVKDFSLQ